MLVDEKVLEGQQWVNDTYAGVAGYVACAEDGSTGWQTMQSLTMGLQHELGISPVVAAFGPATQAALESRGGIRPTETNVNIINVVRYALWGKGYLGGWQMDEFDDDVIMAVNEIHLDMGLSASGGVIPAKIMKACLNMDAYVLLAGGSGEVRTVQRWLNERYIGRSTFFVGPCDGHYSRGVQQALMRAIQYEVGIPESQANGSFGPATRAGLQQHPLGSGDTGVFVRLFSGACVFNSPLEDAETGQVSSASFTDTYDASLRAWVMKFQRFSNLGVNGSGAFPTWAQLLVSTGDPDRSVAACDTSQTITASRAQALYAAGYRYVGRYLARFPGSSNHKEIQPGELTSIFSADLRVVPIWQMDGSSLGAFSHSQGLQHGTAAHDRAEFYGVPSRGVLYFAVDYDAIDGEITSHIIPYFVGVQAGLKQRGSKYRAGVYGSRNVCARVTEATYTAYSYVSGMSWGFSGNLGFPLPLNWAFNQIKEFSFTGDPTGAFALDNVDHRAGSGDSGFRALSAPDGSPAQAVAYVDALYDLAVQFGQYTAGLGEGTPDPNRLVLEYLRHENYSDWRWSRLIGDTWQTMHDQGNGNFQHINWIAWADDHMTFPVRTRYLDPATGVPVHLGHFGATANGVLLKGAGGVTGANRGDFAGWGGDLATFYGDWREHGGSYASGLIWCRDKLAQIGVVSSFGISDMIEDVDGYLLGMACRNGANIAQAFETNVTSGFATRFSRFYDERYGNSTANVVDAGRSMLKNSSDVILNGLKNGAIILAAAGVASLELPDIMPGYKLDPFLEGYAEAIDRLASI